MLAVRDLTMSSLLSLRALKRKSAVMVRLPGAGTTVPLGEASLTGGSSASRVFLAVKMVKTA